jgi:transglutaminase-like putative cysteine protease
MSSVEVRTIEQRVGLVNYYIQEGVRDPLIRRVASSILNPRCGDGWCISEKDWASEVSAIFYWLRHHIRYTLDPHDLELLQRARRTLENKTADCDDLVILAGAILQVVGYPIRMVIIDTGQESGWNHIYLHVGIPPMQPHRWIPFDLAATTEPLGWEMPERAINRKRFFDVRRVDE